MNDAGGCIVTSMPQKLGRLPTAAGALPQWVAPEPLSLAGYVATFAASLILAGRPDVV